MTPALTSNAAWLHKAFNTRPVLTCNAGSLSAKMTDEYVCTLGEASLKKAKEELHEDPKERLGQVETFRQWIVQQHHLSCPTDTLFLLRYLRCAKFSQLRARTILENYFKSKTDLPEWMNDIDMDNPKCKALLKTGYICVLPGTDKVGRKVLVYKPGAFDPASDEYKKPDVIKVVMGLLLHILSDENVQVNGLVYLIDLTGFELKHQLYWSMDDMRKSTKMMQDGVPARFKGFHHYNLNAVFESLLQLFTPLLNKKFKERLHFHGKNLESVYNVIPMSMLPVEYLPDDYKGPNAGTTQALVDGLIEKLASPEIRADILAMTDKKYGIDESKRIAEDVPQASFRKLNID